jgi:hypothetical protein
MAITVKPLLAHSSHSTQTLDDSALSYQSHYNYMPYLPTSNPKPVQAESTEFLIQTDEYWHKDAKHGQHASHADTILGTSIQHHLKSARFSAKWSILSQLLANARPVDLGWSCLSRGNP